MSPSLRASPGMLEDNPPAVPVVSSLIRNRLARRTLATLRLRRSIGMECASRNMARVCFQVPARAKRRVAQVGVSSRSTATSAFGASGSVAARTSVASNEPASGRSGFAYVWPHRSWASSQRDPSEFVLHVEAYEHPGPSRGGGLLACFMNRPGRASRPARSTGGLESTNHTGITARILGGE